MTEQDKKVTEVVETCHSQIRSFPHIIEYLHNRLITDDAINEFKLGYGQFYGNRWITIPIQSPLGHYSAIKLRRDPNDQTEQNKFKMYPMGHGVTLFGLKNLFDENLMPKKDLDIALAEGELDTILLTINGVYAITTTGGAGTFREDWIEVLQYCRRISIVYDLDDAGRKGAEKLSSLILNRFPKKEVFNIKLPEELGKGGDVTDFFKKYGTNVDMLMYELSERVKKPIIKYSEYQEAIKPNGNYSGGDITKADIDRAANTDCEKFVKIVRKSYETSWAHCPFGCKDSSPSMCNYKGDRGFYTYCCSNGGNVITLVQKLHNLSFKEADKFINSKT